MAQISKSSLYITNRIKLKRLILGYSTREFSKIIEKSEGYVGMCESSAAVQQYNSADYPLIAKALNCKLSDIIPPDEWQVSDSHEKVDKKVVSLANPAFAREVIEAILASPKAKDIIDIHALLKHLALSNKYPEEVAVVTKVWEEFVK